MHSHLYTPTGVPPRIFDIFLAHALEIAVAAFSLFGGLMVTLNAKDLDAFASTTPLRFLPFHLVLGIGVFLVFGGVTALAGVLIRRNNIRVELNLEQTGWVTLAVAWATYAWASTYYTDGAALSYLFASAVSIGAALRSVALFMTERQLDAAVREGVEIGSTPIEEETHE